MAVAALPALIAYDALNILLEPFGPYTLDDVTKDAVSAFVIDPDTLKANDAVVANDADWANEALVEPEAYDALNIEFDPNGPYTFEAVTKEAVNAFVIDPDTLNANDAVRAYDALVDPEEYDADNIEFDPNGPYTPDAVIKDAVRAFVIDPDTLRAYDAVNAYDAVVAVDAFPVNEPDIPFVTIKLPVIDVGPVIEILLPDILVRRYIKFPSPSG